MSRHQDDEFNPSNHNMIMLFGKPPSADPATNRKTPALPPPPRKPLPNAEPKSRRESIQQKSEMPSFLKNYASDSLSSNSNASAASYGKFGFDEQIQVGFKAQLAKKMAAYASPDVQTEHVDELQISKKISTYISPDVQIDGAQSPQMASEDEFRWIAPRQPNDFGLYIAKSQEHFKSRTSADSDRTDRSWNQTQNFNECASLKDNDPELLSSNSDNSIHKDPEKSFPNAKQYALSDTLSSTELDLPKRGSILDRVKMFEQKASAAPDELSIHSQQNVVSEMPHDFAKSQKLDVNHVSESRESRSVSTPPPITHPTVVRSYCVYLDPEGTQQEHLDKKKLKDFLTNISIEDNQTSQMFENPEAFLESVSFSGLSSKMVEGDSIDLITRSSRRSSQDISERKISSRISGSMEEFSSPFIFKTISAMFLRTEQKEVEDEEFLSHLDVKNHESDLIDPSVLDLTELGRRIECASFEFLRIFSNEEVQKSLQVDYSVSNSVMKAIAYILLDSGKLETVVRDIVIFDLERAGSAFEILRTNTEQARALMSIVKGLGRRILFQAVKPVVDDILGMGSGIDLFYQSINDAGDQTLRYLLPLADKVLSTTFSMLSLENAENSSDMMILRAICTIICNESLERFPPNYCGLGVISLFFLRFLCPSIVNPKEHGIIADDLDMSVHKNLVALAKILQTIAGSYSQSENLDDKPALYKTYVKSKTKHLEHFFNGLISSKSVWEQAELPNMVTSPQCIKFVAHFLQQMSKNIPCLELISPGIHQLSKSGGGMFSLKSRKIVVSPVHGKLFYIRSDSPTYWSGCIDLLCSRFEEMPKIGRNAKGTHFEVTNLYGIEMKVNCWKQKNGEYQISHRKNIIFWADDREKMLSCLKAIHAVQHSMGMKLENFC